MASKVMHGARAVVSILDLGGDGKSTTIGIWNNFSYQVTYDVQPQFILGRYSAAELTTTGVEPVSITAGGWRVVDHGPFKDGKLTNLKDLLQQEGLLLTVYDRQTKKIIAKISGCLPTGSSSSLSAKDLQQTTNTYIGLLLSDETAENVEAADATDLP